MVERNFRMENPPNGSGSNIRPENSEPSNRGGFGDTFLGQSARIFGRPEQPGPISPEPAPPPDIPPPEAPPGGNGPEGPNGPERRRPPEFEPLPDPMLISARIARLNAKRLDGLTQDEEKTLDRDYFYIKQYAPGKLRADLNYLDSSKESEDEVIKEDELSKLDIQLTQTEFKLRQFNSKHPQLQGLLGQFDRNIGQIRAAHFNIGIREDKLKPENPQQLKDDEKNKVEQELEQQRAALQALEGEQKRLREEMASQAGFDVGGEKGKLLEQYEYLMWERERARHKKLREGIEARGDHTIVPKDELEQDLEPTTEELSGQNLSIVNVQGRVYVANRLIQNAHREIESANELPDDNPDKEEILRNSQEILRQNQEVLLQMNQRLELLFIEAKKKGVFSDIEEDMNQKYGRYRKALAEDGIRERLSAEKQNYLSTLENDADWNAVQQREELIDEEIEKFKGGAIQELDNNGQPTGRMIPLLGIRYLYASGAFDQMIAKRGRELNIRAIRKQIIEVQNLPEDHPGRAERLNSLHGRLRENQAPLINHRLSGEWNINNEERRQQLIEQEKSSYVYTYWDIQLDTSSPEAFIRSAEQFVHDSIRGASKFDPQEFMRRKALVANAVVLQGKDFFQEDQRRRLRWTVETEFDYPIANFSAENFIPTLFEPIMENHIDAEGADRLRNLATLKNGRLIRSVEELENDENEIIFAAEGHRGQLSGDIDAQILLKSLRIKALERKMARVQVRGVDYADRQANLLKMQYEMSDQEMNELFEEINWDAKVATAENVLKNAQVALDQETSYSARKGALNSLNRAKWELSKIKDQKKDAEDEAKNAVELAIQYFNIFGRSAKLGAPTFVMENGPVDSSGRGRGHYIPVDMAVAWLQGVVLDGEAYDNLKAVDQRATKGTGMQGYETIGFNQTQVTKWKNAVALLKKEGFNVRWKGKTFREIINSPRANYIENNFLASYLSLQGRLVNENFQEEISKGRMPWFKYVLDVIDPEGKIKPNPDKQQQLYQVRDAIELSRSIHYRFWTAAHKEWMKDHMRDMEVGTASHIDWGNHYVNLLFQNIMYKHARWATDQRQYSSRAANLISGIPLWLPDLAGFIGARNMKELIQIERKGGVDVYMMQKWMLQFKALLAGAAAVEGTAPEKGDRPWGLLEKPFRSFDRFRALIPDLKAPENLYSTRKEAEEVILQGMDVFASFKDMALAANIMLDYARDAQGAGASHKEIRRIWTEYKYWMRDARAGLPRRYRGARTAYGILARFMEYLEQSNWDGSGESALEGIFGKIDPAHNPTDE